MAIIDLLDPLDFFAEVIDFIQWRRLKKRLRKIEEDENFIPDGWFDDPTERNEKRFWNGLWWTEQVMNGDVVGYEGKFKHLRRLDPPASSDA